MNVLTLSSIFWALSWDPYTGKLVMSWMTKSCGVSVLQVSIQIVRHNVTSVTVPEVAQ